MTEHTHHDRISCIYPFSPASVVFVQVAEGAKGIAAKMPAPFDARKGHEETFKKVL